LALSLTHLGRIVWREKWRLPVPQVDQ
jgi:hypothetical protein